MYCLQAQSALIRSLIGFYSMLFNISHLALWATLLRQGTWVHTSCVANPACKIVRFAHRLVKRFMLGVPAARLFWLWPCS